MDDHRPRTLLWNFVIEIIIYGILVIVYFYVVLRTLGDWLISVSGGNLYIYAVISLLLVFTQAVVLDWVTSFLLNRIKLDRLE